MPGISRSHAISVQDYRLHYLSLAARHGSMRAAADILGIAPSSISRQINQLERDLKIDLVEKGTHKMRLTEAGAIVVEYYDARIHEYEHLLAQLADMRNIRTSTVRLAMGEGLLSSRMLAAVQTTTEAFRDVTIDVVTASSSEVQRMVLDDTAQIGLLFETPDDVRLRVQASIPQPIRLITRPGHPLSSTRPVPLADIAAERLVLPTAGLRLAEILTSVFRERGLPMQAALSSNALRTMADSAAAGIGVTMLPTILVAEEIAAGKLIASPIACDALQDTKVFIVSRVGRRMSDAGVRLMSGLAAALRKSGDAVSEVAA